MHLQLAFMSESFPTLSAAADSAEVRRLQHELKAAKHEIGKLHRQMNALQRHVQKELEAIRRDALAAAAAAAAARPSEAAVGPPGVHTLKPIGRIESCFSQRNGTPRQAGVAPAARSRLRMEWGVPAHTLDGLAAFSHVWLIFLFDQNRGDEVVKSKVHPPCLDGAATGVFACRSPHRPNPIGLSLVELDRIEGDTLYLSGADLIDGTPVVDVKPFVPYADLPLAMGKVRAPEWVHAGGSPRLCVEVTPNARACIQKACAARVPPDGSVALRFFAGAPDAAEAALVQVLQADPRSVYRRHKCSGQQYRVCIDGLVAECRFADDGAMVTVDSVRFRSVAEAEVYDSEPYVAAGSTAEDDTEGPRDLRDPSS